MSVHPKRITFSKYLYALGLDVIFIFKAIIVGKIPLSYAFKNFRQHLAQYPQIKRNEKTRDNDNIST